MGKWDEIKLLDLYKPLYDLVVKKNLKIANRKKGPLTICPAIKGKNYKEGKGIMVVGRAINGWCPLNDIKEEAFLKRLELCSECTLDWVVARTASDRWLRCKENLCPFVDNEPADGRSPITPFWQMVEYIYYQKVCKDLNKNPYDEIVKKAYDEIVKNAYDEIVWSNLYKASYAYGGNPAGFYEEQAELCNKILIQEIIKYKPSEIHFITEKNGRKPGKQSRTWMCDSYQTKAHFKELYDFLEDKENDWTKKVAVYNRPEFHCKEEIWRSREHLSGEQIEQ